MNKPNKNWGQGEILEYDKLLYTYTGPVSKKFLFLCAV